MPCDSGQGEYNYCDHSSEKLLLEKVVELKGKLDSVTDMLCRTLNVLESEDVSVNYLPRDIQRWWVEHKEFDKKEGRR